MLRRDGGSPKNRYAAHQYSVGLWILASLFLIRVLGQLLVAFFDVSFLPPMAEWYSGLIPYPLLFPVQVLILVLLTKICIDFSRGEGLFVRPSPRVGTALTWFGMLYFGTMLLRYIATMALHPDRRWFGGTIPIVFHWVLAAYVLLVGRYHRLTRDPVRIASA